MLSYSTNELNQLNSITLVKFISQSSSPANPDHQHKPSNQMQMTANALSPDQLHLIDSIIKLIAAPKRYLRPMCFSPKAERKTMNVYYKVAVMTNRQVDCISERKQQQKLKYNRLLSLARRKQQKIEIKRKEIICFFPLSPMRLFTLFCSKTAYTQPEPQSHGRPKPFTRKSNNNSIM
jgi:hypothetical protein